MSRGSLVPLIILVVIVTILAVIGYITYSIVQEVTRNTKSKMEKKNVLWTKDGMKVGVKEINNEDYQDRTQRFVFTLSLLLLFSSGDSGVLSLFGSWANGWIVFS